MSSPRRGQVRGTDRQRTARRTHTGVLMAAGLALVLVTTGLASLPVADARPMPDAQVRVNEFANGGPAGSQDVFIELANTGQTDADLDGYRIIHCGASGSRGGDPLVPDLAGVTLAPGQTYTIAHADSTVSDHADEVFTTDLADEATGVWLENAERELLDSLSISPAGRDSVCGPGLPADLDYLQAQSYQRVGTSGDVGADFIKAGRTPGAENAREPDGPIGASDVLVTEIANGGAEADQDVIELGNLGDVSAQIGGWSVYRCTEFGFRTDQTLLATIPDQTGLEPGEVLVLAGAGAQVPDDAQVLRYQDGLSDLGAGAIVVDETGTIRDAVGIYETDGWYQPAMDSTCTQGRALDNRLDFATGQSYQRIETSGDNARDFVVADRDLGRIGTEDDITARPGPEEFIGGPVQVSELTHGGSGGESDMFVELVNTGSEPVALDGWSLERCALDGRRAADPLVSDLGGSPLAPGETFLAVHEASSYAGEHDATFSADLDRGGFGVMLRDAEGTAVDGVGLYPSGHVGESFVDGSARYSPCIAHLSLPSELLESELDVTYQRHQWSGNNAADFIKAEATPGIHDPELRDPADLGAEDLEPVDVEPAPRPEAVASSGPGPVVEGTAADLTVQVEHTTGAEADVTFYGAQRIPLLEHSTRVYLGGSDQAPPVQRRTVPEEPVRDPSSALAAGTAPVVAESRQEYPYQRFELVVPRALEPGSEVVWTGRSTGSNELQMYAWDHDAGQWTLLDAGRAVDGADITLVGSLDTASMVSGRMVDVLIQNGPPTGPRLPDEEPTGEFRDPAAYDFALGYLGDVQSLTHGFRAEFADMVQWTAVNAPDRKIAYTTQVGDVAQQWMWGTHSEPRARDEFRFASDLFGAFEHVDHPYGVLPGNHDNKWGRSNEMFNEFFGPDRFEDTISAFPDGEHSNHAAEFSVDGAEFLVVHLSFLPVLGREEVLDWAHDVIADHPDHNVILAVHELIRPTGELTNREEDRWTAQGEEIFDAVVAPNENVFLVLAGHTSGVALNARHDPAGDGSDRVVVEMLANYQEFGTIEGYRNAAFLRLLQFDIPGGRMAVNTYSPTLEEFHAWPYDNHAEPRYTAADDEFAVDIDLNLRYDRRVETDVIGMVEPAAELGHGVAADGQEVSLTWQDLETGTDYVWFVEASDEGQALLRSPLWPLAVRD